ncbi:ATP-dependent RNA helicase HrpA [Mycetocola reblochoni]|uniref:ATP-dependent helicase hrpA n=2 Tax=Mycetocola reblochoni TaxID=331618 RepID=A0A1R4JGV7_9MICO|nr:ATP-dependent RNA helicase HrpA [Mycetocola reblochoni]RLP68252.1 ATP-dependent RNA helicase HrpA [Mycetocola reblochoni]SJN31257.1 ATP-dependent helicase hrpA [Mycetocola reblochoni REB411]
MPLTISYPAELPVSARKDDIAAAIRDNQVVIVAGATGSGKTTQLPKICLELGRTAIAHTQPRRIAARSIAERVSEELGTELGDVVGYQVRFTDQSSANTQLTVMTDGILLNAMHRDKLLRAYDTIIIDEAHERSLNIDFLLGYLKQLLPRRPELKLVITSATIDVDRFSAHFDDAPIIEVSGRTYPVEIRYRPVLTEADEDGSSPDATSMIDGIVRAADELARDNSGDVLVFLSGEAEIRDAADALRARYGSDRGGSTEILPLYGRLSAEEQHRVFRPSTAAGVKRRIVLATNVAETSLTVPGIRSVIDTGTARISRYSTRSKVQRLPIEAISQASANQRSGRAGRTQAGVAIRLYSEEDFASRPEFTDPEILRTNLAAVILQMISLGLGDIAAFPFLEPPDPRGVKDGLTLLRELGAVTPEGRITAIGRKLSRLPVDPRFGRMIIESAAHGVSREVLAIVAALTIQDPRERPVEKRAQADERHARFADPHGDFITLLNLWNYLEDKRQELSSSALRRLCKAEFINYLRVREWQDVVRQLTRLAKPLGLTIGDPSVDPDGIHKSLLAGLLSQIGIKDQAAADRAAAAKKAGRQGPRSAGDYVAARGTRFVIFPGSTLAKKQPDAVMTSELVETSRLFARTVGAIDPAWAEPIAGDLVTRSHSDPRWEKRQGAAVATEKVTLFGVPIVPGRRIQYDRIDPEAARELFLRHALVEGEWPNDVRRDRLYAFDRRNRQLRAELGRLEEQTRRRDILADDDAVLAFYDRVIPAEVTSVRSFEGWWREARSRTPELLDLSREELLPGDEPAVDERDFPGSWRQADQVFRLSYRFDPGSADDGVRVDIPLALLPRVSPLGFDWQVPGMRRELVTALLKSLPKQIRRTVVPAADWAGRLVTALGDPPQALPDQPTTDADTLTAHLANAIKKQVYVEVDAGDFDLSRVHDHLRVTFRVVDERGRRIRSGKDLGELQRLLSERTAQRVQASTRTAHSIEREGITRWDMDEIPRYVDTESGGNVIRGYPALEDTGDSVRLTVVATAAEQARIMPGGLRRLLLLATPSPVSYVQQHLSAAEKLTLSASPYPSTTALFDDCLRACVDEVLVRLKPDGLLFLRAEFEAVRDRVSQSVMNAMFDTVSTTARILTGQRAAEKALKAATGMNTLSAVTDAKAQLDGLVFPGFISATGRERLAQLPRYVSGIAYRAQRLPENPNRDRAWQNQIDAATRSFLDAGGSIPLAADAPAFLVRTRWLLEEFRISLFAQQLGTAETVSPQRIAKSLRDRD